MVEYYFLSMITDFRLKVFETVARRLNFTRAAEELFITQPAVTRHIKELERLLDARLFKREGRGIALTAEGVRLLGNGGWIPVEAVVGLTVDGYSGFQALVPAALTRERAFPVPAPAPAGMSRREGL